MKVGFDKISITPKVYVGKALAGYTRKEPCSGKLDDLNAYGVLIGFSDKNFLVLIAVDLLKVPLSISNYIKKKIIQNHPYLKKEQILIHATHTHAGFDLTGEFFWPGGFLNVIRGIMFGANQNDKYIIWLSNKIANMVDRLFKVLIPCKAAWAKKKFNPNLVFNRRHPSKHINPFLSVIAFKALNSTSLIGIIINYSCHPTTLSYKNSKLSADYVGKIHEKIDLISHGTIKSIYFNSASGDLNPITTFKRMSNTEEIDKNLVYDQLGTYDDTKEIGYKIGETALNLANSLPVNKFHELNGLEISTKEFWIPMKDVKYFSKKWFINKFVFLFKKLFLINIAKYQILKANFPIFTLNYHFRKYKCKTIVQYLKLKANSEDYEKELAVITIPGELFFEQGERILKSSPSGYNNTLIFQNTQDWIAYLFSLREYKLEGGYEVLPSFSPLCGYYVIKEIINLMHQSI